MAQTSYLPLPLANAVRGAMAARAAAIASAVGAIKVLFLTDVMGVLRDVNDKSSLMTSLSLSDVENLIADGTIAGGMIPKVRCCVEAVQGGVERAHIVDGRAPHAILIELFSDHGCGTMITYDKAE